MKKKLFYTHAVLYYFDAYIMLICYSIESFNNRLAVVLIFINKKQKNNKKMVNKLEVSKKLLKLVLTTRTT